MFDGGRLALGLPFLEAGFVLADKGAQFGIVVFLTIQRVVQRAFRMLFRHRDHSPETSA
jgi:hypothetical protein